MSPVGAFGVTRVGGEGRADAGSHVVVDNVSLMEEATDSKWRSVASATSPVNLRMSFEMPASCGGYVSKQALVGGEVATYHVEEVLVIGRHVETSSGQIFSGTRDVWCLQRGVARAVVCREGCGEACNDVMPVRAAISLLFFVSARELSAIQAQGRVVPIKSGACRRACSSSICRVLHVRIVKQSATLPLPSRCWTRRWQTAACAADVDPPPRACLQSKAS